MKGFIKFEVDGDDKARIEIENIGIDGVMACICELVEFLSTDIENLRGDEFEGGMAEIVEGVTGAAEKLVTFRLGIGEFSQEALLNSIESPKDIEAVKAIFRGVSSEEKDDEK